MNKKIITIILFALILRSLTWNVNYFVGSDSFYHASVIDYFKEHGFSDIIHKGDYCSERVIHEPFGFYLLPVLLPFNATTSMRVTIALFTTINLVLFYYYCKKVNSKFALLCVLLLSVSFINIERSNVYYYRGEHLIMPFILGALLLANSPLLSGLLIGTGSFVWQGYPIGIISLNLTIIFKLLIKYFNKEKIEKSVLNLLISNFVVFFILVLKSYLTNSEVLIFESVILNFYPIFIVFLIILSLLFFSTRKASNKHKIILLSSASIIGLVLILSIFDFGFFELVKPGFGFFSSVDELTPFQFNLEQVIFANNLLLLFPIGFLIFFFKDYKKAFYYTGLAIPSFLLFFSSIRYRYLASYSIIIFFAYLVKNSKKAIIVSALLILSFFAVFNSINTPSGVNDYELSFINSFNFSNYCVNTHWADSSVYEYFGYKARVDSVGGQNVELIKDYYEFLLTNKSVDWGGDSLIVLTQSDWTRVPYMLSVINKSYDYNVETLTHSKGDTFIGSNNSRFLISFEPFRAGLVNESGTFIPENIYLQLDENTHWVVVSNTTLPIINGCLIVYDVNHAFWLSQDLCKNTNLGLLMLASKPGYNLVYSSNLIKAFNITSQQ